MRDNASKWNLAWAAYAGLAYKVTPGLSLELTYRYVNLGKANDRPDELLRRHHRRQCAPRSTSAPSPRRM